MKFIRIMLPTLIGILFIVSAILKLYPIEMLELDLGRHLALPEWIAMIFARLLIGFEIALGILMIIPQRSNRILYWAMVTTLLFSAYLVYLVICFPSVENCGCMGMMVKMTPVESLLKNAGILLLLIMQAFLKHKESFQVHFVTKKFQMCIIGIAFLIPFFLSPVDLEKQELRQKLTGNVNSEVLSVLKDNNQEQVMLMYLSPHCVFCKMLAQKWTWFHRRNHWNIPVYAIFMGENIGADIQLFLHQTGLQMESYQEMNPVEFVQKTHGSLPSVYLVRKGVVVQKDNFISMNESNLKALLR